MKKIIKYLFIGLLSIGLYLPSKAQNDTIIDNGESIEFRASSTSISNIDKDAIANIAVVSSSEVRVFLGYPVSNNTGAPYFFDLDYHNWTNGQTDFSSVAELKEWLYKIWLKRYYKTYTYDGSDNLIQTNVYWIFGSDTTEVSNSGDTITWSGSLMQTFSPND